MNHTAVTLFWDVVMTGDVSGLNLMLTQVLPFDESNSSTSGTGGFALSVVLALLVGVLLGGRVSSFSNKKESANTTQQRVEEDFSVLPCIRSRRSIFPKGYLRNAPTPLNPAIIQSLLDAALWGPFHGKCYSGCAHPARFVILGKQSMVEMQHLTLDYYDKHWKEHWKTLHDYREWRNVTQEEITGRWGPVEYMIAIVMRRQTGPKKLPEWEEAAAVAAATQNMHIQSTKFSQLACYWSSWHDAARDSEEMKEFLGMKDQDKCMGFFIVAQAKPQARKDRRRRDQSLLSVEWRK